MLGKAVRDESGKILVMVLVLLVVGGLLLTPLLGLMSTGLMAGQVYEKKAAELYAADAGVEDAIWRIRDRSLMFNAANWSYPDGLTVNGKNVTVEVYRESIGTGCHKEYRYQIVSTAIGDESSLTGVEAHVYALYLDFTMLLDYAIISDSGVQLQPGITIHGDIYLPDKNNLTNLGSNITGYVADGSDPDRQGITWPSAQELRDYYWKDVKDLAPYTASSIDVANAPTLGPLFREGALSIDNTSKADATMVLKNTVYVKGKLEFDQPGDPKAYTIDLNGKTIFVDGTITFSGHRVTLKGSGCIIATGDIVFQPSVTSEPGDFVLVMSVEGEVWSKPSGEFSGCLAGKTHVQVHPGGEVHHTDLNDTALNFPMGDEREGSRESRLSILSWEIK